MRQALFITTAVSDWLATATSARSVQAVSPRVLHVFDQVCNLVDGDKRVISWVTPEIGKGPFSLVMALPHGRFTDFITSESQISIDGLVLQAGSLIIDTSAAEFWDARPLWESVSATAIDTYLPLFERKLANFSGDGFLFGNGRFDKLKASRSDPTAQKAQNAIATLQEGLRTVDLIACREGARGLAGLGLGLTPAGDDYLMGVMYGLWLTNFGSSGFYQVNSTCRGGSRTAPTLKYHSPQCNVEAQRIIAILTEEAVAQTTTLSGAWLEAAARGEAGEVWHELVEAMGDKRETAVAEPIEAAVAQAIDRILAVGHTSGADALAGFVMVMTR